MSIAEAMGSLTAQVVCHPSAEDAPSPLVRHLLTGDLHLIYRFVAADDPAGDPRPLTRQDLASWQISAGVVRLVAVENLIQRAGTAGQRALIEQIAAGQPILRFFGEQPLAGLLDSPSFRERIQRLTDGPALITVPRQDVVLATALSSATAAAELLRITRRIYRNAVRPLSCRPIRLDGQSLHCLPTVSPPVDLALAG